MVWPFGKSQKVTDREIELLKVRSEQIAKQMEAFEQAALDGEEQWMLVKCKPKSKVNHPLRHEGDAVCVT